MTAPARPPEAFDSSAMRHWHDARLLEDRGRHANANHLIGFAAECAIKIALVRAHRGNLPKGYKIHINELWDKVRPQAFQRTFPGLMALLKLSNPFHDWSIDHRYCEEGTVSEESAARHRDIAKRLLGSVGLTGTHQGD